MSLADIAAWLRGSADDLEKRDLVTRVEELEKGAQPSSAQMHSDAPLGDDEDYDPDELAKAAITGAARNDLPDSAFAYVEPGGVKDGSGKTAPRKLRHFIIRNASGSYDAGHVRNALARMGEGAKFSTEARPKVLAAAKSLGVEVSKADETGRSDFEMIVPLTKADEEGRFVYGVVLSPGVRDSQGDIVTAADIAKAAHEFMAEFRQMDVQHSDVYKTADGVPVATPVESFIAPVAFELNGSKVLKGAWVMGAEVNAPATRAKVRDGQITGFSIAGTGVRLPD